MAYININDIYQNIKQNVQTQQVPSLKSNALIM